MHHPANCRSQRVLWMLEEPGLPHEVRAYRHHPRAMLAPLEFQAVHSLGEALVLQDLDAGGGAGPYHSPECNRRLSDGYDAARAALDWSVGLAPGNVFSPSQTASRFVRFNVPK